MSSIVIACSNEPEAELLKKSLASDFKVTVISSEKEFKKLGNGTDFLLIDEDFSKKGGLDFLETVSNGNSLPTIVLAPDHNRKNATRAFLLGAYNYIVKSGNYTQLLGIIIKSTIRRHNEVIKLKNTIVELKDRIASLEIQLEDIPTTQPTAGKPTPKSSLVEEIISKFKRGEIALPKIPEINIELKKIIDLGASNDEITKLVKRIPDISTKLIKVANTPYYRSSADITDIGMAVECLGPAVVKQYLDVIANRSFYTTDNKRYSPIIEKLWIHTLSCAYSTQTTAAFIKFEINADAFIMGLIHDIGKLVLIQIIAEIDLQNRLSKDIHELDIHKSLDTFHGDFGAIILKRWKLPQIYLNAALFHDNIEKAKPVTKDLLLIYFSNLLVKHMGFDIKDNTPDIDITKIPAAKLLELDPTTIGEIQYQVKESMKAVKGIFF
ncbi:MAG: HDOD domain-containing protein [Desulfobacterales bacterium]|nr:HDOD domain-containing protein [Desulfobacterales bacterium]